MDIPIKTWKVRFFQTARGDSPVEDFIKEQDETMYAKILNAIVLLKNGGPFLKPPYIKKIQDKFEEHINWLRPQDQLNRATIGFESAIKFMNATDNQQLLKKFWDRTHELDTIRGENIIKVIPEINELKL